MRLVRRDRYLSNPMISMAYVLQYGRNNTPEDYEEGPRIFILLNLFSNYHVPNTIFGPLTLNLMTQKH